MKRFLTILTVFAISLPSYAQFLWPIKGTDAGSNIISRPQHYVDNELNFDELFIAADEGVEVISPSDGTIVSFGINYLHNLSTSTSYSVESTFDEAIQEVTAEADLSKINPKYLSGQVGIRLSDGRKIYISGLRGTMRFKTGMKIKKGDLLGTAGYAYKAFEGPHIGLSISTAKGTCDDPMTPFGLETTFVAPGEIVIPDVLTPEQAQEDFNILMDAYVELYPSFDDIITPDKFAEFKNVASSKISSGINYDDFYDIVRSSISAELAHDSHISILTPSSWRTQISYNSHLRLGVVGDSLFVTSALGECQHLVGKRVDSLDNESAEEVIRRVTNMSIKYDANVKSSYERTALIGWNYCYHNQVNRQRTTIIKFTDGTKYIDVWHQPGEGGTHIPANWSSLSLDYNKRLFHKYNYNWDFKELNDSTVLLTLNTFALNDVEVDDIINKIKENVEKEYMIIDVRLNSGGYVAALTRLLSAFIDKQPTPLNQYSKVNSNGIFKSLRYSLNYDPAFSPFEEYKSIDGKEGFYANPEYPMDEIVPDSVAYYPGKLYILTTDESLSAATLFPAFLVRNHRAVTVGRETGSAYHYLTASKFADIQLPNSKIQVRIPLVKEVFDDVVNDRVPYGRGLLPDYEVPVTYEEFFTAENDIILEKTMELIAEGKYLGENPFEVKGDAMPDKSSGRKSLYIYLLLGILAVVSVIWVIRKRED